MKRATKQNLIVIGIAIFSVLVMTAIGLFLISEATSTSPSNERNNPTVPLAKLEAPNNGPMLPIMNLDGTWTHKTDKGGVFEATVTADAIKIVMKAPTGTSLVYWNGTFENSQSVGAVVVSKLIEDKAILSQSKTKNFTVGDETLSFEFTSMGITKTVELKRI